MSELKPIYSDSDHEAALIEVERLWGTTSGTPEGDRLNALAKLIADYESQHHPMDPPAPIDANKFRMKQLQLGAPSGLKYHFDPAEHKWKI